MPDKKSDIIDVIAKILDIVEVDAENKALVLDIASNITTTATTWVSTIHWRSGFSDEILGRDGCLCQTKSQISSMLYPSVIQGIELMVGGYEVPGNTFMDIVDGLTRDVYVCTDSTKLTTNVTTAKETYVKLAKQMTVERTDSTKLTTNVTTAKETYVKLAKQMTVERNNEWNYGTEIFIDTENGMNLITKAGASGSGTNTGFCDGIYFDTAETGQREFPVERNNEWNYGTEIFIDTENGMNLITKAGASGSGTNTGFCDGIYFDTAETGQREFLLLGRLWVGSTSGAFCSDCLGLGVAGWSFLARLSLSVFGGEFA